MKAAILKKGLFIAGGLGLVVWALARKAESTSSEIKTVEASLDMDEEMETPVTPSVTPSPVNTGIVPPDITPPLQPDNEVTLSFTVPVEVESPGPEQDPVETKPVEVAPPPFASNINLKSDAFKTEESWATNMTQSDGFKTEESTPAWATNMTQSDGFKTDESMPEPVKVAMNVMRQVQLSVPVSVPVYSGSTNMVDPMYMDGAPTLKTLEAEQFV